jgi:hypothetical protein
MWNFSDTQIQVKKRDAGSALRTKAKTCSDVFIGKGRIQAVYASGKAY